MKSHLYREQPQQFGISQYWVAMCGVKTLVGDKFKITGMCKKCATVAESKNILIDGYTGVIAK